MEYEVYNEMEDITYRPSLHEEDVVDWFEVVYGIEINKNN